MAGKSDQDQDAMRAVEGRRPKPADDAPDISGQKDPEPKTQDRVSTPGDGAGVAPDPGDDADPGVG